MARYEDIPDWIQKVTPIETEDSREKIITELNYLKGSFVGHTLRALEDEEKLRLARDYQCELDAQLVENLSYDEGLPHTDYRLGYNDAIRRIAYLIREQKKG